MKMIPPATPVAYPWPFALRPGTNKRLNFQPLTTRQVYSTGNYLVHTAYMFINKMWVT